MSSLNRVMLIGNLTRDPELRTISTGSQVCELGLAVNRTWTEPDGQKRDEVTYLDIAFWGKTAENAAKYLAKGRSVYIEGRLQVDTWQDAQSGQERQKLKIVGERLQFLGGTSGQASANISHADNEADEQAPPPPPKGGQSTQPRPRYQGRAA